MLSSSWALMELSWILSTTTAGISNTGPDDSVGVAEEATGVSLSLSSLAGSQDSVSFSRLTSRSALRSRDTDNVSSMTSERLTLGRPRSIPEEDTSILLMASRGSLLKPGGWSTAMPLKPISREVRETSILDRSPTSKPLTPISSPSNPACQG